MAPTGGGGGGGGGMKRLGCGEGGTKRVRRDWAWESKDKSPLGGLIRGGLIRTLIRVALIRVGYLGLVCNSKQTNPGISRTN